MSTTEFKNFILKAIRFKRSLGLWNALNTYILMSVDGGKVHGCVAVGVLQVYWGLVV